MALSFVQSCLTLCDPMNCSISGLPVLLHLPEFAQTALVMPSSHLTLWHPLLLLPSVFLSIRDFSNESAICIRWPKYWSFSYSISLSSECSGLISHKIDWFDLPAVQGTLRSLYQHHRTSILLRPAFFTVQLSQLYMTTEKTTALTILTFVSTVMSLLFNMPSAAAAKSLQSWLVITFLPRSKRLLISSMQSPSAVILEPSKIKSDTVSIVSHLFAMKWWDWMPWS